MEGWRDGGRDGWCAFVGVLSSHLFCLTFFSPRGFVALCVCFLLLVHATCQHHSYVNSYCYVNYYSVNYYYYVNYHYVNSYYYVNYYYSENYDYVHYSPHHDRAKAWCPA